MRVPRATEEAAAVDDMSLRGDSISNVHISDETSRFDDIAGKFVADDNRRFHPAASPVVPLEDVNVGTADPGAAHSDENFIVSDGRFRNFSQNKSASGGFL